MVTPRALFFLAEQNWRDVPPSHFPLEEETMNTLTDTSEHRGHLSDRQEREAKVTLTYSASKTFELVAEVLDRWNRPVSKYLAIFGAFLVLLMSFVIVLDVFLRTFFDAPIAASIEYEQLMLLVVVFLSISNTMIKKGHVGVDIISSKFPPKVRMVTGAILSPISIFVFVLIGTQNVLEAIDKFQLGELYEIAGWPTWPFYLIIVLGCALITIVFLKNLLENYARMLLTFSKPWIWLVLAASITAISVLSPYLMDLLSVELRAFETGLYGMLFLAVLMFLGYPIAFAMGFIGIIGNWYLSGAATSFGIVRMSIFNTVADYFLCVIPLFILMGFLCYMAGLSGKLYEAAYKWFGQLPGGLSIATIFGCAGFSAICGDSMATAATMGSVALPEMKKFRYSDSLATGCIAAGGTLGILIPPSIGFIIYGIITEQSVGKLFLAGILPGILLTLMFSAMVVIRCYMNPALGPAAPKVDFREKVRSLKGIIPVVGLFVLVIGGLYRGFFTPTEAGGVGAAGALIIALCSKQFTWNRLLDALTETGRMTAMIFVIVIGVTLLGYFISLSEIPLLLSSFIVSLPVSRYVILLLIFIFYILLGDWINIIPMIMLTLPIVFPTVVALGFDPIWFGVTMVIIMEMGQISPPVGINVFVIYGVAKDVPMSKIYLGTLPFLLVEILIIIILIFFPDIAMMLPNAMEGLAEIHG